MAVSSFYIFVIISSGVSFLLLFSSIGILDLYRIETLGFRLSVKSIESTPWINGGCFIQRDFKRFWGNPFSRAKKLGNGHFAEKTSNKNCRTIFSEF